MDSKDKMYTMQEMAEKLRVNKTTVYRYLKKQDIAPATTKSNTNLYDATVLQRLKKHFNSHNNSNEPKKSANEQLIASLQQQVTDLKSELADEKKRSDKALQMKDDQINALNKLMDQNQQLLLNTQEENKRLLSLNPPKEKTVRDGNFRESKQSQDKKDNPVENRKSPKKKSFLGKLFGK
ncbi:hypothetical protein LRLP16767_LRLP167_01346 [Limosilactobacillus reuteri]|uniref:Helix-turn-helix domain-containing protein n=1 Tax=Limosilactobacillus reuteri TaxID=1598 RepID=A0A0U5KSJ6_LIMRT|nr:hypothetical protein LRLP16767_LRLP167_01346 [Limosilactobacillus reuteri]